MIKNARNVLWMTLSLFLMYSCQSDVVYRKGKDIPGAEWDKDHVLSYKFEIEDTVQPYSVFLNIRNTSKYNFKNLFLFIETTSPEGYSVRDTFECILADDKGRWYGKGWGDIYENKIPYKRYIRFPRTGQYNLKIQQAMRREKLEHITDIGIVIEEAKRPGK